MKSLRNTEPFLWMEEKCSQTESRDSTLYTITPYQGNPVFTTRDEEYNNVI